MFLSAVQAQQSLRGWLPSWTSLNAIAFPW